jgi:membrane associated rhomboid family serine protease
MDRDDNLAERVERLEGAQARQHVVSTTVFFAGLFLFLIGLLFSVTKVGPNVKLCAAVVGTIVLAILIWLVH